MRAMQLNWSLGQEDGLSSQDMSHALQLTRLLCQENSPLLQRVSHESPGVGLGPTQLGRKKPALFMKLICFSFQHYRFTDTRFNSLLQLLWAFCPAMQMQCSRSTP